MSVSIYGNFKNRDELFIALGQTYWAPVKPHIKPGAMFAGQLLLDRSSTAASVALASARIAAGPPRSDG